METESRPPRSWAPTARVVATLAFSREGEQLHHRVALFPGAGLSTASSLCFKPGLIGDGCAFNRGLLRQSCARSPALNSPLGRDFRVERVRGVSGERTH